MKLRFRSSRSADSNDNSIASKIGASIFFLIFGGMGTFIAVMLSIALIRKEAPWYLIFFLLIPAVFIFIGFGGLFMTWFGKKREAKAAKARHKGNEKNALILFGFMFFSIGLVITYIMLIRPLIGIWNARDWVETPCRVISAEVGVHDGDEGNTYSVDIVYKYTVDEKQYRADRYDFMGGSSSGRRTKQAIVDQYRNAADSVCYVDPDNPSESVLQRSLTAKNLIGLFPLIFVGVGMGVMVFGFKQKFRSGRQQWMPAEREDNLEGSVLLKPTSGPIKMLVIALVVCLFWNGIIAFPIVEIIHSIKAGQPEWGLTLFMTLFGAVGLGLIGWVIYQLLALFNPRYLLMLMPEQICPGTPCLIGWKAFGKPGRIQKFSLKLIGREEATYRRGTKTQTDKRIFFEQTLINTSNPDEIAKNEAEVTIPADTMHSFEADNNKIVWLFELHGDIHRWPDVKHEYKFTVAPQPIAEEAQL